MPGPADLRTRKKQVLEKQLEQLWDDYDKTIAQSTNALSAADSNKLDRAAQNIYARIEKLDAEIQTLDLLPSPSDAAPSSSTETGRRHDLIRDKLPEIDFKRLERTLQAIIDDHSDQGCAALLLLRHSRMMAGEWGAKRLRRILQGTTREGGFRHIELEFGAWETVNAAALLQGLGRHLNVPTECDFAALSRLVVDTLCGALISGSVVLIECRRCDGLLTQTDNLRSLVEKFWADLVRSLTDKAAQFAEVKIILLLLAEEELPDCGLLTDCCCLADQFRREHLLEIQLDTWTPSDIGSWLGRYSGRQLDKPTIDTWAKKLHRANNGIPYMIADALLRECCAP